MSVVGKGEQRVDAVSNETEHLVVKAGESMKVTDWCSCNQRQVSRKR